MLKMCFGRPCEVGLDAGRLEPRTELGDGPIDVGLAALAPRIEQLRQLAEALGLEHLEREVLELPLDLPDPEALRQRRVDLHRLARDALLLLGGQAVQRSHVVEAVGQLDEDDADVLRHREQHLADVLGLLLFVAMGGEARQLGDAVDEMGHLGTEALLDVRQAVLGVLRDVVEQRGLDGDRVDPQLGHDLRRGDGMGHVRLAGRADLALVRRNGQVEGTLDAAQVGGRMVVGHRGLEGRPERLEIGARRASGADRWRPARTSPGRGLRRLLRGSRSRGGRRGMTRGRRVRRRGVPCRRRRAFRARRRRRGRGRCGLRSAGGHGAQG